jgi:hypothetical protein
MMMPRAVSPDLSRSLAVAGRAPQRRLVRAHAENRSRTAAGWTICVTPDGLSGYAIRVIEAAQ